MTHWRRYSMYAVAKVGDKDYVATACGKLVGAEETTSEPAEATCRQCVEVFGMLEMYKYTSPGV